MDSANSGSLQSSSGGDEEYDSAFLNPSIHIGGSISNSQAPQPPPPHNSHPSSLFDPLSNFLDPFTRTTPSSNTNSPLNLDTVWSRGLRSEPNCTDIGTLVGSSSSIQNISDPQDSNRVPLRHQLSMPLLPGAATGARASAPSDQTNVVRNSKKRSRASRRAPTTVLTTNTTNFRAMVQEFTGIPAPPFPASASSFPRNRLDIFNNASLMMKAGHLEPQQLSSSLLRPFAQKIQSPLFVSSSSSMVDIPRTTNTSTSTSNLTANNNYQLLFELGLPNQTQNLLNMKNPILSSSQSLLESTLPPTQYPLGNVPTFFGTKSQGSSAIPSTNSQLKIGVFDEFGMNHGNVRTHLGGFPNLVTSDGMSLRTENENTTPIWADGVGSNDGDQGHHSRSFNGNFDNPRRVNSCKMNYSGSSLDFNADKVPENVSSRGEGMVDSWICSSD